MVEIKRTGADVRARVEALKQELRMDMVWIDTGSGKVLSPQSVYVTTLLRGKIGILEWVLGKEEEKNSI